MQNKGTNWLAEIGGRLWAVWALVLFVSTMLIAFLFYLPCFAMREPKASVWHRSVSRAWMTFFLNLIGCPLRVSGEQHFSKGQNYVIACNHNSLMDVPVTTPFMPNPNKTIGKKDFAYVPLFGWIYSLGSVLIDRKDPDSRKRSYHRMKAVLRIGLDMVIYPEGTRNKSDEPLKPFHDGAFRLAKECNKPIIPVLLFNTKKVMPANKPFYLLPCPLYMHFLPPIYPGELSLTEMKNLAFRQMWDYYEENSRKL